MQVNQTSPLRASTPAPMPAAGSLNPSAKTVARVGLAVAVAVLDQPHPVVFDLVSRRIPCPGYFLYMATRSATVRQARSSSSQFMWSRVSVTPACRRNVSAT